MAEMSSKNLQKAMESTFSKTDGRERPVKPLRYEIRSAYDSFNQLRKKMSRTVGEGDLARFEECIVLIADESTMDVEWVKSMLRTQMVNKVPYDKLEPAILIGVAGGFLDVAKQLYRFLLRLH